MSIDPLAVSDRIRAEYQSYLRSTFPLRSPELAEAFSTQLEGDSALARGPILQATAPFKTGATLRELVEEGLLSVGFLEFSEAALPLDRPLYVHQEEAIRKARAGRNLMISTGTGSGKTECFLIPIIDGLLREAEAGTLGAPGVRALLLYPMNALANDQLKRLRGMLVDLEEITFARYTGDTKTRKKDAEEDFRTRYPGEPRLPNELVSREVIQESPPHLLLTNYAMLEYLLLRPRDSSLFDGPTGRHWRYLALDEIHVYGGSAGTEVGMLIRRVRDRVFGDGDERLACFGTSATLGRGVEDYPKLTEFGTQLFNEPFEWTDEPDRQDVVGAVRKELKRGEATSRVDPQDLDRLRAAVRSGASLAEVREVVDVDSEASSVPEFLADVLVNDEHMIGLQNCLVKGSVEMSQVAREVFDGPDAEERLVDLVDLGVSARHGEDDSPVLPARYHFFLRALEGAFACFHPEHPGDAPRIRLSRHKDCPDCRRTGKSARMFELGVCRGCGAEYLVGRVIKDGPGSSFTSVSSRTAGFDRALMESPLGDAEDDEDESISGFGEDAIEALVCPGCGAFSVSAEATLHCSCSEPPTPKRIWLSKPSREKGPTRQCIACARRAKPDPIRRFTGGADAPVSVIATDLYQEVPPSKTSSAHTVGQGRKLLTFSDSRQDAAFFAPYLERTYGRALERRMIARSLEAMRDERPRPEDLIGRIVSDSERALVLDPDESRAGNRARVATWLTRELLAMDRRQSLDGTGMAEIRVAIPRRHETPVALTKLGFSEEESSDLIQVLLESVRLSGAISVLEGVDIRAEEFEPRNRELGVREKSASFESIAWSPMSALNRRLDFLKKVFRKRGIEEDPGIVLSGIWRMLTDDSVWGKTLISVPGQDGPIWKLNAERFEFLPGAPERVPLKCGTCNQLWWRTVSGVCPVFRCDGELLPVVDPGGLLNNHYARLYRELEPIGMSVQEHTAQWRSEEASSIQDKFVNGEVNVLSCSTTFELGVDVGEVEAVLLRNVPPSPANYVQRAGRAGRRTDSAALVVTFAQLRSHDFTFFADPMKMVDGSIPPPRIVLDNAPIVRRHVHSMAFAAYQREFGESRRVEDFFLSPDRDVSRDDEFLEWLRSQPESVGEAVDRVVPGTVKEAIGVQTWNWVEALARPTEQEPTWGWLERASREIESEVGILDELIEEAARDKKYPRAGYLEGVKRSMSSRQLIPFLASRNVLPKYGFPVDVVELNLAKTGDPVANRIELARDLKMAIVDYAPGAVTVAGKKLWQSKGLVSRSDQNWPEYGWAACESCGHFRHAIEEVPGSCPVCQSESTRARGKFAIPIYGFVGEAHSSPGETRPSRNATVETFFGSYLDDPPVPKPVPELSSQTPVEASFSRQGRITVINSGPGAVGFRICGWCGYGEPIVGKKAPKKHRSAARPNHECEGMLRQLDLGHQFLTDVVEISIGGNHDMDSLRSTLYALLESVPALDIPQEDVDGTVRYSTSGRAALVIFDAVPGGAGHAKRLASRLPDLARAALERVETCECGEETSCYSCLRSYRNQIWHDDLRRGDALRLLGALVQ